MRGTPGGCGAGHECVADDAGPVDDEARSLRGRQWSRYPQAETASRSTSASRGNGNSLSSANWRWLSRSSHDTTASAAPSSTSSGWICVPVELSRAQPPEVAWIERDHRPPLGVLVEPPALAGGGGEIEGRRNIADAGRAGSHAAEVEGCDRTEDLLVGEGRETESGGDVHGAAGDLHHAEDGPEYRRPGREARRRGAQDGDGHDEREPAGRRCPGQVGSAEDRPDGVFPQMVERMGEPDSPDRGEHRQRPEQPHGCGDRADGGQCEAQPGREPQRSIKPVEVVFVEAGEPLTHQATVGKRRQRHGPEGRAHPRLLSRVRLNT